VEGTYRPRKPARLTWLFATLAAALFSSWPTALQHRVRDRLSVNGAGLARYLYGLPVAGALLDGWFICSQSAWGWRWLAGTL
jgi:hypothetical protein